MTTKLGVVMDPIQSIIFKKDSTLAMLLEAQSRGFELYYMTQSDLYLSQGDAWGSATPLTVFNDSQCWFELGETRRINLSELDVILMRKDPPFDMEYIYSTYLLEMAEKQGVLVINKPQSLRDANEKLFTSWFPQCCPESLVTRDRQLLREFIRKYDAVIFKPLNGMGGKSVFKLNRQDPNMNVIIENLTENGTCYMMAQRFIPEIDKGDKRVLLIDGEPIAYALARIPPEGDIRGNLAIGAKGVGVELTDRDYWICAQVGPMLKAKGLIFVGLDIIGDYLTEMNVTSPTCIREIDAAFGLNISAKLLDCIQRKLIRKQ